MDLTYLPIIYSIYGCDHFPHSGASMSFDRKGPIVLEPPEQPRTECDGEGS